MYSISEGKSSYERLISFFPCFWILLNSLNLTAGLGVQYWSNYSKQCTLQPLPIWIKVLVTRIHLSFNWLKNTGEVVEKYWYKLQTGEESSTKSPLQCFILFLKSISVNSFVFFTLQLNLHCSFCCLCLYIEMEIPWCSLAEKAVHSDTYKSLIIFSFLVTTGKTGKRKRSLWC